MNTLVIDKEGQIPSSSRTPSGDAGESILRPNAYIENFPRFSVNVNLHHLLDRLSEQAERVGYERLQATVLCVQPTDEGFTVETNGGDRFHTEYVIAATKNTTDYLVGVDGVGIIDRGKTFVDTDERGRTGVDGLYAAGRLAEKPIRRSSMSATARGGGHAAGGRRSTVLPQLGRA